MLRPSVPVIPGRPITVPLSEMDDDEPFTVHLTCCDPDRSLCGLDLTDGDENVDADDEFVCEVCFNKDQLGQTCGAFFCSLRQRWREWRSS